MGQFACDEGAVDLLGRFLDGIDPWPYLSMVLCAGSSSFSESTTYATLEIPRFFGADGIVDLQLGDWSITGNPGNCTASLSNQTFSYSYWPIAGTLDGWAIVGSGGSLGFPSAPVYWCGSISPTFTPTIPNGGSYVLSGLTLTLGQCSTSPPGPTVLLNDSFAGSGSVALGSHTPLVGGPWDVVLGNLVVHSGVCSATATGDNLAFVPGSDSPISMSMTYVHATNTEPGLWLLATDDNNALFVFSDSNNWYVVSKVGGVPTILNTVAGSLVGGDTYSFTLHQTYRYVILFVNGVEAIDWSPVGSSSFGSQIGFDLYNASGVPSAQVLAVEVTTP